MHCCRCPGDSTQLAAPCQLPLSGVTTTPTASYCPLLGSAFAGRVPGGSTNAAQYVRVPGGDLRDDLALGVRVAIPLSPAYLRVLRLELEDQHSPRAVENQRPGRHRYGWIPRSVHSAVIPAVTGGTRGSGVSCLRSGRRRFLYTSTLTGSLAQSSKDLVTQPSGAREVSWPDGRLHEGGVMVYGRDVTVRSE
jgi:hypothetical protein